MKRSHHPARKKHASANWKYVYGLIPIIGITVFSVLFNVYVTPEYVINWLGVNNAYLLIFILALLGGLTTFSGIPYHLVVVTLATGGMNPLSLGLTTAVGVMIGDSTSYYLGHRGSAYIPVLFQRFFKKTHTLILKYPRLFPLFCFLYGALVPFSNDFIAISAGLMRYPFWKVILPLGLGNLIFNVTIALLATRANSLLQGIVY